MKTLEKDKPFEVGNIVTIVRGDVIVGVSRVKKVQQYQRRRKITVGTRFYNDSGHPWVHEPFLPSIRHYKKGDEILLRREALTGILHGRLRTVTPEDIRAFSEEDFAAVVRIFDVKICDTPADKRGAVDPDF